MKMIFKKMLKGTKEEGDYVYWRLARRTGSISVWQSEWFVCHVRLKTTLKAHKITAMFLCKYTRGALEVLGMDVNVLDGDRYRHHYTPLCLHSLSLRCYSVFTSPFFIFYFLFFALREHPPSCCPPLLLPVPSHCPLPLLSTIPLYLLSSQCPFISHSARAVSSLPISWSHRFPFLSVILRQGRRSGSGVGACSTHQD